MAKISSKAVIGFLLVLGIVGVLFVGVFPTQSVVSISNIRLLDGGELVTVSSVVNQSGETFWVIPSNNIERRAKTDLPDKKITVKRDIGIKFVSKGARCEYVLSQKNKSTFLGTYRYWVVNQPTIQQAPFDIEIYRSHRFTSGLPSTPEKVLSFNAFTQQEQSYFPKDGGEIKFQRLGELSNGFNCPTSSVAVVKDGSNFKLVDRTQLEIKLNDTDFFECLVSVFFGRGDSRCVTGLFREIEPPSEWRVCPRFSSCAGGYDPSLLNNRKIFYTLEGSRAPFVLTNFDKKFAGIVFEPVKVDADISLSESQISVTDETEKNVVVTITNLSQRRATFNLTASSQTGNAGFVLSSLQIPDLAGGGTTTRRVTIRGVREGSDLVCVQVTSPSQVPNSMRLKEACVSVNVAKEPPPNFCGNGVCEPPFENVLTCASDCQVTPPPPPLKGDTDKEKARKDCIARTGDGLFVLDWSFSETVKKHFLTDVPFVGVLFPTTTGFSCNPIYNPITIILAIVSGIIGILLFQKFVLGSGK